MRFSPNAVFDTIRVLETAMRVETICKTLRMSRLTLWEWRLDPIFRAWLQARLNQTSDDNWPLILRRHELLAINGSVKSAEFIAKVCFMSAKLAGARHDADLGDADPTTDYKVVLLVPRPPALEGADTAQRSPQASSVG